METSLTTWETKERAGLLALETDEWREKRRIAENPTTTAEVLGRFAYEVVAADSAAFRARENNPEWNNHAASLVEALVAHPNTPPLVLARLLNRSPWPARAFCDNPIAPLLLLEMPHFVHKLRGIATYRLLREERAPLPIVRAIAALPYPPKGVVSALDEQAWEVSLHVSLAGEIRTQAEFEAQFKTYCRELAFGNIVRPVRAKTPLGREHQKDDKYLRRIKANRYCDLYEVGLIPAWLGKPPLAVNPSPHRRMVKMVNDWLRFETIPGSPEEHKLWAEITPDLAEQPELASLLRRDATANDLARLAMMEKGDRSSLHNVIAAHPNATPEVMNLLLRNEPFVGDIQRSLTAHPQVSAELIAAFLQGSHPEARRLARRHRLAPPNARELSRAAALQHAHRGGASHYELIIACLHGALPLEQLVKCGVGFASYTRMIAALGLPVAPIPVPNAEDSVCSTLDLLEHLARDGNRLVRWAAQTRLADPDFVFTWTEE